MGSTTDNFWPGRVWMARVGILLSVILPLLIAGCGGSGSAGDASTSGNYGHPGVTGGGSSVVTSSSGRLASITDGKSGEDLTVELGTTSATIRAGTFQADYQAVLSDLAGELTESSSIRFLNLPVRLRVTDSESVLEQSDASQDIEFTVTAVKNSSIYKAVILIVDYAAARAAGASTPLRRYLRLSEMGANAGTNADGKLSATFKLRSTDVGVVMVMSDSGNPGGFGTQPASPVDPSSLVAAADNDPTKINLTWRARKVDGGGFAVARAAGATSPVCGGDFDVTATETSSAPVTDSEGKSLYEYAVTLSSLQEGTAYAIRVCASDGGDPAIYSGPGAQTAGTTAARALAVLSNTPAANTSSTSISVTVGGTGVTHYKSAIVNAANCNAASYPATWDPVSTPVTASGLSDGTYRLCVIGKKNAANLQVVATENSWTVDTVPPDITVAPALAPAVQGPSGGVNIALKAADPAVHVAGTVTGSSAELYKAVTSTTDCATESYTGTSGTLVRAGSFSVDGAWKICMSAVDLAGNTSFASSANFTVDLTAPVLTSVTLANDASDTYINDSEKAATTDLTGTPVASEAGVTFTYAIAASTATCGGALTYSSVIPQPGAMATDGLYKVCVKMVDALANPGYGTSPVITRDTVAPGLATGMLWTGPAADSFLNGVERGTATVILTAAVSTEAAATYRHVLAGSASLCPSATYASSALPGANSSGITADGAYKACVEMTDAAGNVGYAASSSNITVDTTAPTGSLSLANDASDTWINAAEKTTSSLALTTQASSTDPDVATKEYKLVTSSTTCGSPLAFGAAIPASNSGDFGPDGDYKVCAALTDNAGNIGYAGSPVIHLDTVVPTMTSAALANEVSDGFINLAEKDLTSNVIAAAVASESVTFQYKVSAASATCGSESYSSSAIPKINDADLAVDGSYKVCVKMTDGAGNIGYGNSPSFVRDIAPPSLTGGLAWTGAAADGYINDAEKSGTTAILSAASANETATYSYGIVTPSTSCDASVTYANSLPTASHAAITGDGSYRACVRMVDTAGNTGFGQSAVNLVRDTVAPTATMNLVNAAADTLISATEHASSSLAMGSAPTGSPDFASASYKLIKSNVSCAGALTFSNSIPAADSSDFIDGDGDYVICMRVLDLAGNAGFSSSGTITLDQLPPALVSAALANEAADGYINDAEKSLTGALISAATASETATITYVAAVSSATCSSLSGYGSSIPGTDSSALSSDGSYKVCVKMVDPAGNTGFGASSTITRDTVAPTLNSGLALAGDGTDAYINLAERSNTSALVTAAVSPDAAGIKYVLVDGAASCSSAAGYATSIPASNNAGFTAQGTYKVCVEMTDAAGNEGYAASASMTLDSIAPTATTTLANAASDAVVNASEFASSTLAIIASPTGSETLAASTYKLVTLATTCGQALVYGSGVPAANSADFLSDGDYKVCMRLVDAAGNVGYSASPTMALDTNPPSFTASIALANDAADGYINNAEKTSTSSLIATPSSAGASATEYVVVSNASTCSAATGYGATIPKSNDAAMVSDGSWKVCVKLSDAGGNAAYGASPVIIRDTAAPALASGMAWTGAAWDGYLNTTERAGTSAILTAAVAGETSTFKYTIVSSSSTCAAATYSASTLPAANAAEISGDGDYKGCVEISDLAGNKGYGATASNLSVDTSAPTATMAFINAAASDGLINASERASSTLSMGAAPSGSPDLASATYKLIPSATTCGVALSFAGGIPAADSVDFGSDGTYVICMRLLDNAGNIGYSSSSTITLDTTAPALSSIALANDATDSYINSTESSATNALTGAATANEGATLTYVLAASGAACAAQSGYSSTIPKSNDSGFSGDGTWKVCVRMVDTAGNTGYGASATFTRDTVAPSLASGLAWSGPAANGYLNASERSTSTAIVTVAVANETATYQYLSVSSAGSCSAGSFSSSSVPGADDSAITGDGAWKVCARMADTAGNIAWAATATNVVVDAVAPSITSFPLANDASDGYVSTAERTSSAAMAGPLSASADLASANYKLIPSSTSCGGALSFGASIPAASSTDFSTDQAYVICVRLEDNAGNVSFASSSTITLDTAAPVFTSIALANGASDGYINDSEKSSTSAVATAATSSGATSTQYAIAANASACASASGYGSAVPQINDAGFTADGSWKVCVKLSDAAGNITYGASGVIVRDTAAPTLASGLALQPPADDSWLNSTDRVSSNAIASAASANEPATYEYTLATGSCSSAAGYSGTMPLANATAINADGTWKVCSKMTDTAGNTGYVNSSTFTVDTAGPVFTSLALANGASDGYLTSAEAAASANLAGSLSGSGYASDDYKLVTSSTTCGTPLTFGTMPKSDSADFSGDGSYKVCVRLVDAGGNMTYGATSVFTRDTAAPSFTSMALANTALDGYLNASERAATSGITGTLTASGYDLTEYKIAASSATCSGLSSWSGSPPQANDAGITGDGAWKVCVKLSDTAGNLTYGSTSNFSVDTVGPALSSALTLTGAASDGYVSSAELSGAAAVMATPSFAEAATVTYVMVTNSATCSSASGWGGTIPLASAFGGSPFNSDADYKVCVRAEDAAGNVTYNGSPAISRDTSGPSFTSLVLANAAADGYLNSADRSLLTDVAGPLVAEAGATGTFSATASTTTCDGALTYAPAIQKANDGAFASDGTYKICVRLQDTAGNVSWASSPTFIVDTVSASFSSVALANTAVDGYLSSADRSSSLALVADAVTSGADAVYYSVMTAAATCNATATFGAAGAKPAANTVDITADGTWKVCVKVTDAAGNAAAYGNSNSFTVDTATPSATVTTTGSLSISSTSGSTTELAGAISDASPSSGISGAVVSVADASGNCLNNSKTAFNATCPNWIAGTVGSSSWSVAVADGMFLKGASYTVSVKATDLAGNQQSSDGTGSFTWSAPEGSDLWNTNVVFAGSNAAQALASAVDSQGRLVVAGYDTHSGGATRGRIKRYTQNGIEDASIDIIIGDNANNYMVWGLATGASDSIFVVGSKHNGSNNDWFVKKYSSAGVEDTSDWDKTFNGPRNDDDIAYSVAVASDGSVVVGGYSRRAVSTSSADDWRIVKYSSAGVESCSQDIDIGSQQKDERIRSLAIRNSTSRIYVAGYSDSPGTSRGWAVGEFNLGTCAELNDTVIVRGSSDEAYSIALDSAGQVVVAGKTSEFAGSSPDPWVEVMSTSFVSVCAFRPDVAAVSEALAVAVDSLDNIYVGGYRTAANQNWWLRKFSSSCVEDTANWNKVLNGAGNGNDRIQSVVITSGVNDTDNVYAVGWGSGASAGSGNNDWWIKKFSGSP